MAKQNRHRLIEIEQSSDSDEPPDEGQSSKVASLPTPSRRRSRIPFPKNVNSSRNFIVSPNYREFKERFFPNASLADWNNWQWQLKNSYTSFAELEELFEPGAINRAELNENERRLPLRITPYYASLLRSEPSGSPLCKTVVPSAAELLRAPGEVSDPLSEAGMSPVPNLVHRYPDRVLFLATGFCSVYCRYCTRSHAVADEIKLPTGKRAWEPALEYIRNHREIRDVIVSGGDVLTMADFQIEYLLTQLRAIEHLEIIRIGTKIPAVLPQRINGPLLTILKKHHPLLMSLHFTHPSELTPESVAACERLADAGIPLGSQTVLLKGVNDEPSVMTELMHRLLKARVRPYYIYQCDPIPGSLHFRTPVRRGIEIIQAMRGYTSGYAIPQFVVDAPEGGGKIPLLPNYVESWEEGGELVLRNYRGDRHVYPDQAPDESSERAAASLEGADTSVKSDEKFSC